MQVSKWRRLKKKIHLKPKLPLILFLLQNDVSIIPV